jgi:hypothetical protein
MWEAIPRSAEFVHCVPPPMTAQPGDSQHSRSMIEYPPTVCEGVAIARPGNADATKPWISAAGSSGMR